MSGNTVGGCVALLDTPDRDVGSIQLPRWGRVVPADDVVPWQVVDPHGVTVEPIQRFLRDFVARGNPGRQRPQLRLWPVALVAVVGGCRHGLG